MEVTKIKKIHLENFKGIKERDVVFDDITTIKGANKAGKTSIVDGFMWVLFGKNSQYVEKFDVRPLDEDGKQIDYVDIVVSVLLDIDGKEVELKKTQKQNWVKKHGAENPTFQGNVNTYEIDGYPRSEKDYKAFINGIASEDIFKMITSPTYFPSLKWKEQRDILMRFASDISDVELAKQLGNFDALIPELEKAPSTEDIAKKFTKAKKELNDKLAELPVRIDEISKTKVEDNSQELIAEREELNGRLVMIDHEKLSQLKEQAMKIQFDISKRSQEIETENKYKTVALRDEILDLKTKRNDNVAFNLKNDSIIKIDEFSLANSKESLAKAKEQLAYYSNYTFDESKYVFDENSSVCSSCGQALPVSKVEKIKADLIEKRNKDKAYLEGQLEEKRNLIKADIEKIEKEIVNLTKIIADCKFAKENIKTEYDTLSAEIDRLTAEMNNVPVARPEDDEICIELNNALSNVNSQIADLENANNDAAVINSKIKFDIEMLDEKLNRIKGNATVDARIEELKTEQAETSQKYADCERILYLLGEFTKEKLNKISQDVNSRFKMVNFKLFDVAINGGVSETCECTVNGVPYSSLNRSTQLVAGLDIINTLMDVYKVKCPIFLDNAECINSFNIPKMDTQFIGLYVSDDKELVIE